MSDEDSSTAWRVEGNDIGESLRIEFFGESLRIEFSAGTVRLDPPTIFYQLGK